MTQRQLDMIHGGSNNDLLTNIICYEYGKQCIKWPETTRR